MTAALPNIESTYYASTHQDIFHRASGGCYVGILYPTLPRGTVVWATQTVLPNAPETLPAASHEQTQVDKAAT